MKLLYLFFPFLFLFACSPSGNQAVEEIALPSDSGQVVTTGNTTFGDSSVQTKVNLLLNECNKPYAIGSPTRIFACMDTMSDVIGVIRFNTPVELLGRDTVVGMFFKIVHGNVKGFVLENDLALRTYPSSVFGHLIRYYVVNEAVYKWDEARNLFVDTFHFQEMPARAIHFYDSLKWKNVDAVISTSDQNGCCGCTMYNHYYMDTQNRLDSIFSTWNYLDDSDEPEGLSSHLFLPKDAEKELIHFYEDRYFPIYDKAGKESDMVRQQISSYYKWNGKKMLLVKQVKL